MTAYRQLTEEELLARLQSGEHQFVERKPAAQKDVIQRVAVSFANSVKSPREGVLFIGVDDKTGKPNGKLGDDLGKAQRDVRGYLDQCYPPIPYYMTLVNVEGQQVIAVVVTESSQTPHFTGKAYVRIGDSTIDASEEKIQELVEERISVVRDLRLWIGKTVTFATRITMRSRLQSTVHRYWSEDDGQIESVTPYFIVWKQLDSSTKLSVSLDQVKLTWDTQKDRLKVWLP
jgi:predicted HTH transcriptional regulator